MIRKSCYLFRCVQRMNPCYVPFDRKHLIKQIRNSPKYDLQVNITARQFLDPDHNYCISIDSCTKLIGTYAAFIYCGREVRNWLKHA